MFNRLFNGNSNSNNNGFPPYSNLSSSSSNSGFIEPQSDVDINRFRQKNLKHTSGDNKVYSSKPPTEQHRDIKSNATISINLTTISQAIKKFKRMNSIISDCQQYTGSSGITGELLDVYNSLDDNTSTLLSELELYIKSLSTVTDTSLNIYEATDNQKYSELEGLISYLFDVHEENMNTVTNTLSSDSPDTLISQVTILSSNEYMTSFNEMNSFFDEQYVDILNDFKVKLSVQYQSFLSKTVPTVLNTMVEDIYSRNASNAYGSKEYKEGLVDFKENFAVSVSQKYQINIENYDVENTNIPTKLWNSGNNYDKSLLLLTYKTTDFKALQNTFEENIQNSFNSKYTISNNIPYLENSFNLINIANQFYTRDFSEVLNSDEPEQEIKKIIRDYQSLINNPNLLPGNNSLNIEVLNPIGVDYQKKAEAWYETLKDLGYLDKVNNEYSSDIIYQSTNNLEFLLGVMEENGEQGFREVYNRYYQKLGISSEESSTYIDSFFDYNYGDGSNAFNNLLIYNGIVNGLKSPVDEFCNNKLKLDATKQNYKLALLESLDTSMVTESDITSAKERLGNDSKYLEDWQIKAYALLNKEDSRYADLILSDTLYYNIQSGKGYDSAKEQVYQMTGETLKQFTTNLTKNEVLGNIFGDTLGSLLGSTYAILGGAYDGVYSSVEGVYEFGEGLLDITGLISSEDRMNANDYRKSYLQQFLSGNYSLLDTEKDKEFFEFLDNKKTQLDILKTEYNLASSVGNMLPSMALSAFVSPAAMSAWMFASVTGNEKKQMLINGKDKDGWTYLEAASKGLIAVASERMLGALKGYGAKENDVIKIFKNYDNYSNFGKFITGTLSNQVNEVGEELFENACNHVLEYVFNGKIPQGSELIAETWETAYMTFLSTPLINFMGTSFQNSDYSLINRQQTHNINGIDATYSQSELLRFVDENGQLDNMKFMDYLRDNGRLSAIELDFNTVNKLKIPNIFKVSYNTSSNEYILEYMDGHIDKVNDLSKVTNYNANDTSFKINGNYYTQEQVELFENALKLFSSDSELSDNMKVEYSNEKMQEVREKLLSLANDDEQKTAIFGQLADIIVRQMERGNPYIEKEYNRIIELIDEKKVDSCFWWFNKCSSFWSSYNTVGFDPNAPLIDRTIIHEYAHAMHYHFDSIEINKYDTDYNHPLYNESDNNYYIECGNKKYNYSDIVKKTRNVFSQGKFAQFNDYVVDKMIRDRDNLMLNDLRSKGKSYDVVLNEKIADYQNKITSADYKEILAKLNLNKNNTYISPEELQKAAEIAVTRPYRSLTIDNNDNYTMIRSFSDIVDSIYGGHHNYQLMGKHGESYYGGANLNSKSNSEGIAKQFEESVAQVIPIIQLSPEAMPLMYEILGDDYMNMIMAVVNRIYDAR